MRKISKLLNWCENNPGWTVFFLLGFHFCISVIMYFLTKCSSLNGFHNGDGLWAYAADSYSYHREAISFANLLRQGGILLWWHETTLWPHVKLISLCYFFLGDTPLSFEIINGPVWVATVLTIWGLCRIVFRDSIYMCYIPVILFSINPCYILLTTQLLKDPIYIMGFSFIMLGWALLLKVNRCWLGGVLIILGFIVMVLLRPYVKNIVFPILFIFVFGIVFIKKGIRKVAFLCC